VQTIVERQMLIGGEPGGGTERWTDRQYVYGPEYVDEFICQIDRHEEFPRPAESADYPRPGPPTTHQDILGWISNTDSGHKKFNWCQVAPIAA
jgi:hypothetical protein